MPIYEYVCQSCGHAFETLVRGGERPTCPRCHGVRLDKQLSAFAVGARTTGDAPATSPCDTCGNRRGPGACGLS